MFYRIAGICGRCFRQRPGKRRKNSSGCVVNRGTGALAAQFTAVDTNSVRNLTGAVSGSYHADVAGVQLTVSETLFGLPRLIPAARP